MDYKTLYDKIKNDNINETTARIYTLNLMNIFKTYKLKFSETMFNDFRIINDIKNSDSTDSTKKNKINSIVVFLKAFNAPKDIIDRYKDESDILSSRINRQNRKLEKSPKERKNWVSVDELKEKLKELKDKIYEDKKLNLSDLDNYIKYIILLIHINIPLRNDLSNAYIMNLTQFKNTETEKKNYILLSPKIGYIILNDFKTVKSNGIQKIKLEGDLLKEINKYYKFLKTYKKDKNIDNDLFIFKDDGKQFTRNDYTKLFNSIFGKPISTTMIRKIIVSDTWNIQKIKTLSEKMQHSISQALNNYVKV
jgi:hypothetical protein